MGFEQLYQGFLYGNTGMFYGLRMHLRYRLPALAEVIALLVVRAFGAETFGLCHDSFRNVV